MNPAFSYIATGLIAITPPAKLPVTHAVIAQVPQINTEQVDPIILERCTRENINRTIDRTARDTTNTIQSAIGSAIENPFNSVNGALDTLGRIIADSPEMTERTIEQLPHSLNQGADSLGRVIADSPETTRAIMQCVQRYQETSNEKDIKIPAKSQNYNQIRNYTVKPLALPAK